MQKYLLESIIDIFLKSCRKKAKRKNREQLWFGPNKENEEKESFSDGCVSGEHKRDGGKMKGIGGRTAAMNEGHAQMLR